MRAILGLFMFCAVVAAQSTPPCTTVTETLYVPSPSGAVLMPTGSFVNLTINYTLPAGTTIIGPGTVLATINNGIWSPRQRFTVGQQVVDSNGNTQVVTIAGTSGAPTPTWATGTSALTQDGSVTWQNRGALSLQPSINTCLQQGNWTAQWTVLQSAAGQPLAPLRYTRYWTVNVSGTTTVTGIQVTTPPAPPIFSVTAVPPLIFSSSYVMSCPTCVTTSGTGVSILNATSASSTAYSGTCSPTPPSLVAGTTILFKPDVANSSTSFTIACTGLGSPASTILSNTNAQPPIGFLVVSPNNYYYATYNGSVWVFMAGFGVENNGGSIYANRVINLTQSAGILQNVSQSGGITQIQTSPDTSVLQTLANVQTNSPLFAASSGGTANAQTAHYLPIATIGTFIAGSGPWCWTPANANTGSATFSPDTLTAVTIKKAGGTGLVNLISGDLLTTALACGYYDGTYLELQNPQAGTAVPPRYQAFLCEPGLGDGFNPIAAQTYLMSTCINEFGATYTITGVWCFTDNAGSSTLNITNGANTALLTEAITCSNTLPGVAGTQSGTTTIANGDGIKFTFVSDGTSKQTTWVIAGTR